MKRTLGLSLLAALHYLPSGAAEVCFVPSVNGLNHSVDCSWSCRVFHCAGRVPVRGRRRDHRGSAETDRGASGVVGWYHFTLSDPTVMVMRHTARARLLLHGGGAGQGHRARC